MPVTLTFDELVGGLQEMIRRAEPAGLVAEIRIIGGTAVARLRPDIERRTQDIDAYIRAHGDRPKRARRDRHRDRE
jgi:hypothetical protein